jgi:hypothetical protein
MRPAKFITLLIAIHASEVMMVFRAPETQMDSVEKYLSATEVIDWNHPSVLGKAQEISAGVRSARDA